MNYIQNKYKFKKYIRLKSIIILKLYYKFKNIILFIYIEIGKIKNHFGRIIANK